MANVALRRTDAALRYRFVALRQTDAALRRRYAALRRLDVGNWQAFAATVRRFPAELSASVPDRADA